MNDATTAPADTEAATQTGPTYGYRPPPRYRTITAAAGTAFDGTGSGSTPLSATIRSNLTGAELDWLKAAKAKGDPEIHARLAPLVTAWNVEGQRYDADADALVWEPLPPPAEAGAAVFARVDGWTVAWLYIQAINAPTTLGEDAAKTSPPSAGRPAGGFSERPPSKDDAPSPTPSPSSRAKRSTSSPTPGAST